MSIHKLCFMEQFASYLKSLPKSPLTEAVTALYEGASLVSSDPNLQERPFVEVMQELWDLDSYKSPNTTLVDYGVQFITNLANEGTVSKQILPSKNYSISDQGEVIDHGEIDLKRVVEKAYSDKSTISEVVDMLNNYAESLHKFKKRDATSELWEKVYAFNRDDCIDMNVLHQLYGDGALMGHTDNIQKTKSSIWHDGMLYNPDAISNKIFDKYCDIVSNTKFEQVPIPDSEYRLMNLKNRLSGNRVNLPKYRNVPSVKLPSFDEFMSNPPTEVLNQVFEELKPAATPGRNNDDMTFYLADIKKHRQNLGID